VEMTAPAALTKGRAKGNGWRGGWLGHRFGLEEVAKRNVPASDGNRNTSQSFQGGTTFTI
jgi:hypothetical protein